jgi:hypothetical protein
MLCSTRMFLTQISVGVLRVIYVRSLAFSFSCLPPHSIRSFPLMPSRFTSFPLSTPRSAHFTPTRSARSRALWNSGSARRADPLHFVGPRRPGRSPRRPRGRCPPHRGHADRCPPNGQQSDHPRRWVSARGTTARAGHCDHHGDGGR